MAESSKERRKSERKKCEKLVRFDGDNFSIYSRVTDLSNNGAFLATHYLLDPGTSIRLHLLDVPDKNLPTEACVIRIVGQTTDGSDSVGLGIEFIGSDDTTAA